MSALVCATLLAAAGLAGCSGDSSCDSVARDICVRLEECGALESVFSGGAQCVESFNAMFEVSESDDARCREVWDESRSLDCRGFVDYFSI